VLLSACPFRVGDRIRLHAGGLAGQAEGVVTTLGLLYTTLDHGADRIMVPNSVVLSAAIVPLREPSGVDVRVRLPALEEIDEDEVVVRVSAAPAAPEEGSRLADQVLEALVEVTSNHAPEPALSAR
jgi:small conductance mechanosensitive channel